MPTVRELRGKFVLPIDLLPLEGMRCEKSR
jgi:hypothetical protein